MGGRSAIATREFQLRANSGRASPKPGTDGPVAVVVHRLGRTKRRSPAAATRAAGRGWGALCTRRGPSSPKAEPRTVPTSAAMSGSPTSTAADARRCETPGLDATALISRRRPCPSRVPVGRCRRNREALASRPVSAWRPASGSGPAWRAAGGRAATVRASARARAPAWSGLRRPGWTGSRAARARPSAGRRQRRIRGGHRPDLWRDAVGAGSTYPAREQRRAHAERHGRPQSDAWHGGAAGRGLGRETLRVPPRLPGCCGRHWPRPRRRRRRCLPRSQERPSTPSPRGVLRSRGGAPRGSRATRHEAAVGAQGRAVGANEELVYLPIRPAAPR